MLTAAAVVAVQTSERSVNNMAVEFTAVAEQIVSANNNVLFTEDVITCKKGYVDHRRGSGLVELRGITNQCRARYAVTYSGNIAVADTTEGGVVGEVAVALSLNGEPISSSVRRYTAVAVEQYGAVSATEIIDVARGTEVTVAIKNVSEGTATTPASAIQTENFSIIIERIA